MKMFYTLALLFSCIITLGLSQSFCIDPFIDIQNTRPGPELIRNGGFDDYGTFPWFSSDAEGFSVVAFAGGACGNHSASIDTFYTRTDCPRRNAGLYQKVQLSQTAPKKVFISGYGRGENVSGVADADFSLYADVYFTDGTARYGIFVPFPLNNQFTLVNLTINEAKPIDYIFVNLLFRVHTGRAYFDLISLKEDVVNVYPLGVNILAEPGFETCNPGNWTKIGGAGCQIQYCGNDYVRSGFGSLSLGNQTSGFCFTQVRQLVYFSPPIINTLTFSAYLRIDYALGAQSANYVSLTISDEEFGIAVETIPFEPTQGFQKFSVSLTPKKPTGVFALSLLLQGRASGVTWDDAELILS